MKWPMVLVISLFVVFTGCVMVEENRNGPSDQEAVSGSATVFNHRGNAWAERPGTPESRDEFCKTMRALSFQGRSAIPVLAAALLNDDRDVRYEAATALGKIGDPAWIAVPHLKKLRTDRDGKVRQAADRALKQIQKGKPRSRPIEL